MDVIPLTPELYLLRLTASNAYLWVGPTGDLTLVDCGLRGEDVAIVTALERLGHSRDRLRHLIVTHAHEDHAGSAAALADRGEVIVAAHRDDAAVLRGERPAPPIVLTESEKPIWQSVIDRHGRLPPAPPVRVDRELVGGDLVDFGGGARVIDLPGHTDGSLGLYLPSSRTLFAGDVVANAGRLMPGVFNQDGAAVAAAFRRLSTLDIETLCVGHGDPIVSGAGQRMREVVA